MIEKYLRKQGCAFSFHGGCVTIPRSVLRELLKENKVLKDELDFWRDQFKKYTDPEPPLF